MIKAERLMWVAVVLLLALAAYSVWSSRSGEFSFLAAGVLYFAAFITAASYSIVTDLERRE